MLTLMNDATKNEAVKHEYETQELTLDQIVPNPDNLYNMDGIDELADSILLAGRVLQNIVVTAADENGKHMIISGHRRHLACQKLVEAGHPEFGTITALIENETDRSLRELMLIYSNSTSRVLTDAEKMRQAQRATDILKSLKAEGKFAGRIRDAVARMLKTTSGQLARYAAISNNLTNETLKEAFDDGRIGVSAAYEASRLPEEKQQEVADKLSASGEVTIRDVKGEDEPAAVENTNSEGIPMTDELLEIPSKYKAEITIHTIKKDGKYYAASSGRYKSGGWRFFPHTKYSKPYSTRRQAFNAAVVEVAKRSSELHRILHQSGYWVVGAPDIDEEDTAKTAPNPHNEQPVIRVKLQAEEPPAGKAENEYRQSPTEYAFQTVTNELAALEESYRGAAERHTAMGGDEQGKANLFATAKLLKQILDLVAKIEKEDTENE